MTVSREPQPCRRRARDIRFHKEMAITREGFLRTLARALDGRELHLRQDQVMVRETDRCFAIRLRVQDAHRLGALRLPRLRVDFHFSGYRQSEAVELMSHIDRHFQRGGG